MVGVGRAREPYPLVYATNLPTRGTINKVLSAIDSTLPMYG